MAPTWLTRIGLECLTSGKSKELLFCCVQKVPLKASVVWCVCVFLLVIHARKFLGQGPLSHVSGRALVWMQPRSERMQTRTNGGLGRQRWLLQDHSSPARLFMLLETAEELSTPRTTEGPQHPMEILGAPQHVTQCRALVSEVSSLSPPMSSLFTAFFIYKIFI